MSQDEFTKLFTYMQAEFSQIDQRFEQMDARLDKVYGVLDTILKNQEAEQQERLAMSRQLGRHERWHHQVADQVGVKLSYEH